MKLQMCKGTDEIGLGGNKYVVNNETWRNISQGGYWFRLGHDGRFVPIGDIGLGGSPGDGTCLVTTVGGFSESSHEVRASLTPSPLFPQAADDGWLIFRR